MVSSIVIVHSSIIEFLSLTCKPTIVSHLIFSPSSPTTLHSTEYRVLRTEFSGTIHLYRGIIQNSPQYKYTIPKITTTPTSPDTNLQLKNNQGRLAPYGWSLRDPVRPIGYTHRKGWVHPKRWQVYFSVPRTVDSSPYDVVEREKSTKLKGFVA